MGCSSSTRSVNTIETIKKSENDSMTATNKNIEKTDEKLVDNSLNQIKLDKNPEIDENFQPALSPMVIKGASKAEESVSALEQKKESEGYLTNMPQSKAMFVFEGDDIAGDIDMEKDDEPVIADINENIPLIELTDNPIEDILKKLHLLIINNDIPEDKIRICLSHSVFANKSEYDKFEIRECNKFSFVCANKKIKWNKKPFSQLVRDVTEYFNQSGLHDYFGFEWTSFLLENENHKIEFKLRKWCPSSEKFEDLKIETNSDDKIRIVLIFNENDSNAIQKIKEINLEKIKINNDDFEFYPIFGSTMKKKEEAIEKIKYMSMLGINDTELFFFRKKDDETKLEKLINYISEDNKQEIISTIILFDKNGTIRFIGSPRNFFVENITSYINPSYFTEEEYLRAKNYLLNNLAEQDQTICNGKILLQKNDIYDSNLNLIESQYEPLKLEIRNNEEAFKNIFSDFKHSIINRKSNAIKLDDTKNSVSKHVNKILQDMEVNIENVQYTTGLSVIKRYNIALSDKLKKFKSTRDKKKVSNFNFHINTDIFDEFRMPLLDQLGQLRLNPFIENLRYISICPMLGSKLPTTLNLLDAEANQEIQIELDETFPKLFLILRNCKNSGDKADVTQYLKIIWNNIQSKEDLLNNLQIFLIYTGDSQDEAKELIEDSFKEQKIYLLNSTFSSNFPYAIDNEGPKIYLIINNKENIIKYHGAPSEIILSDTLANILDGNDIIAYKPNYPMSYDYYKSNMKKAFKGFKDLLEESFKDSEHFYKPIVQLSFTKECLFINHECLNVHCKNITLKILMKTVSENLITGNENIKEMLKNLKKEYGVNLKILKIPCITLNITNDNKCCSTCNKEISEFHPENSIQEFYYDQENSLSYCIDCEKDLKNYETNLIYLKYPKENEVILNEVIQGFYEMNIKARSQLENNEMFSCSICDVSLDGHRVVWMSLIHLNHIVDYEQEITHPILICDRKCFPYLKEKYVKNNINNLLYDVRLNDDEKEKLKLCAIDRDNFIFKKIIL